MVALKAFNSTTLSRIENNTIFNELRPYLGMSELGEDCSRYLWYRFRWAFVKLISSRMRRLFKRGHREEPAIIEELEAVGVICFGFQEEVTMAFGHCKGHNDGKALGVIESPKTVHLLECKTMADKYFKDCKKQGVEASNPKYFCQGQIYMHKFGLTRCLFCAVNKNDDDYYFERFNYDPSFAGDLERKAESIILAEEPPEKISENPSWFKCKWCDALEICQYDAPINVSCRTCRNVDIENNGIWSCNLHNLRLSTGQQKLACNAYRAVI